MTTYACLALLLGTLSIDLTTAQSAATQASEPVVLDFAHRSDVSSPDGSWHVTLLKDGDETEPPWLVLKQLDTPPARLLQIQRWWCQVLWRQDSKALAIVDARFANHYFLLVDFIAGGGKSLQVDLSPMLERSLRASVQGYELDKIYLKVFRWLPDGALLAGVDGVVYKHIRPEPTWQPSEDLYRGLVIDVSRPSLVRQVDKRAMRREYGIDLENQMW